jgi:hypothetical protein
MYTKKSAPFALPERNGAKPIWTPNLIGDDNNNPNRKYNLIGIVKPPAIWIDLLRSPSGCFYGPFPSSSAIQGWLVQEGPHQLFRLKADSRSLKTRLSSITVTLAITELPTDSEPRIGKARASLSTGGQPQINLTLNSATELVKRAQLVLIENLLNSLSGCS